jgi:D-aspartate ligase
MPPVAIVMNMFYTGLGIARSLGERGIPVIGLTSHRGIYGNYTRYAKTVFCPDSRNEPEDLLTYLVRLGKDLDHRGVIFPTRDDDVLFLDRFREHLTPHFHIAVPESSVVRACLNKWETYRWGQRAGVPTPRCWMVGEPGDLYTVAPELTYPCVLKPLAAHHWRQGRNWEIVGGRKAIAIHSLEQLFSEYAQISRVNCQVLLQEMIPGDDDQLFIAACYLDKNSNLVASFTAQKLVQSPSLFGTGCIVQTVDRPELVEPAAKILKCMQFTGIAEVEFKWDSICGEFKLIEINPRPWDQHRLGNACGVDLVYLAYCELAGRPMPVTAKQVSGHRWIAEDAFFMTALRLLSKRDAKLRSMFQQAKGERIYGIWSMGDEFPFVAYMSRFLPQTGWAGIRYLGSILLRQVLGRTLKNKKGTDYESHFQEAKTKT